MLWDLDDGKHLYTLDSSDPIHSQSHILSQQDQVIRNYQPCNCPIRIESLPLTDQSEVINI